MKDTDNKRYRLLKDISMPYKSIKAGTVGVEIAPSGYVSFGEGTNSLAYSIKDIEKQPEWFEPIPEPPLSKDKERIEVSHLWQHDNFRGNGNDAFWYQFCTSKPIEHINNSNLKQAIESALNEDTVASYDGVYFKTKQGERLYTQKEVDDMIKEACKEKDKYGWGISIPTDIARNPDGSPKYANLPKTRWFTEEAYQKEVDAIREEAFEAGREKVQDWKSLPYWENKYATFQDYLQSLTKDKEVDTGKEWQICAVRDTDGKLFYTDMLPTKGETIEAVKRLSDNCVMEVGSKDYAYGKPCKILSFRVMENGCMWCCVEFENGNKYENVNILSLDKLPTPTNVEQEYKYSWVGQQEKVKAEKM